MTKEGYFNICFDLYDLTYVVSINLDEAKLFWSTSFFHNIYFPSSLTHLIKTVELTNYIELFFYRDIGFDRQ